MYVEMRDSSRIHRCDENCRCPLHPDLPLIYAPAEDDHACQNVDCFYGHGMRDRQLPTIMITSWGRQNEKNTLRQAAHQKWVEVHSLHVGAIEDPFDLIRRCEWCTYHVQTHTIAVQLLQQFQPRVLEEFLALVREGAEVMSLWTRSATATPDLPPELQKE